MPRFHRVALLITLLAVQVSLSAGAANAARPGSNHPARSIGAPPPVPAARAKFASPNSASKIHLLILFRAWGLYW
jgi:hypothetical protein